MKSFLSNIIINTIVVSYQTFYTKKSQKYVQNVIFRYVCKNVGPLLNILIISTRFVLSLCLFSASFENGQPLILFRYECLIFALVF